MLTMTLISRVLASAISAAPVQPPADQPVAPPTDQTERILDELSRLRAEVAALAERIDQATGTTGAPRAVPADLQALLAALDSPDYDEREQAENELRRAVVERVWLLPRAEGLSAEGSQRVRQIVQQSTILSRLGPVMVDASPEEFNAFWRLIAGEPRWVFDALGDDTALIETALTRPPLEDGLAVGLIYAALVGDDTRAEVQLVALENVPRADSPSLRAALRRLLAPPPNLEAPARIRAMARRASLDTSRAGPAPLALDGLLAAGEPEALPFMLASFELLKRGAGNTDFHIADMIVEYGDVRAVPELIAIARARHDSREGVRWRVNEIGIRPGDAEIVAAARLMQMNLDALKVRTTARGRTIPSYPNHYGFDDDDDRAAAFDAIEAAAKAAGPFLPIKGLDEARALVEGRAD